MFFLVNIEKSSIRNDPFFYIFVQIKIMEKSKVLSPQIPCVF